MRIRPRLLRIALVVLLTPLLVIALVVGALTTEAGQSLLARAIGWGSGGQVHLAGFSCMTIAGFSLHFAIGMIIAALSLFAISWLTTSTSTDTTNERRR